MNYRKFTDDSDTDAYGKENNFQKNLKKNISKDKENEKEKNTQELQQYQNSTYKQKRAQRMSKEYFSYNQHKKGTKKQIQSQIDEQTYRLSTYNTQYELQITKIEENIKNIFANVESQNTFNFRFKVDKSLNDEKTVLILKNQDKYQNLEQICFIFEMGSLVLWGFTVEQEEFIHQTISDLDKDYIFQNIFDLNKIQQEQQTTIQISKKQDKQLQQEEPEPDIMFFTNQENDQGKIIDNNDVIHLDSKELSEKLAFSYAMSQSMKLLAYEIAVDEIIEQTKDIPRELADSGTIKLSQKDISKLQGQLFVQRSDINLNSNLLDSPDYFWNEDKYEKTYDYTRKWYNIPSRIKILNSRLDIIKELYDMLNDELHHKHESYLEWIIIWILVIEVLIELLWNILLKDILGFFSH